MMNPTQSAQDKMLSPTASAEMFGRNIAAVVDKGQSLVTVLDTLVEYLVVADEATIAEANKYLYRWIAGE